MTTCHLCTDTPTEAGLLDHVRLMHPDQWDGGPDRWPDGDLVVVDLALHPADFGEV